ncbi:MAG: CpaF family protein [Lachnospiraceae bacterium]|nr:CpaF family protein [Lachnospiraceae bacterium]
MEWHKEAECLEDRLRKEILEQIDLSRDVSDDELLEMIQGKICEMGNDTYLTVEQRLEMQRHVFHSLRKLDVLEDLLSDESITEIMINGPDNIYLERDGQVYKSDYHFTSLEKLGDVIQKIVSVNNKMANETHPIIDTRLGDGSRINIVLPPIAVDYPIVSIRKFPKDHITMNRLIEYESISDEIVEFIRKLVIAGYNIFVSGGTGSGKTTFLNAMAEFIPSDERVVTIEDSAELRLYGISNLIRLEAREATMEGKYEISIRELLKASLRMRPDRIIVGECRGQEALEMLQAFNTGHDGSFSTGHANSARDMLSRLETMVLMAGELPIVSIRSQIASGIDIIIHLGRMRDKSRKLIEITEVIGMKGSEIELRSLYRFEESSDDGRVRGAWIKENELMHQEKLKRAGLLT